MDMIEQAIRCYAKSLPKDISKAYHHKNSFMVDNNDIPSFDRVLVFDTETTNDQYQNLKFGFFQFYHYHKLKNQAIFYDNVTEKELAILQEYSKNHNIILITVREFIDHIFYPYIYELKSVCIGFNLSFDLLRLINSFGDARGRNKGGFSLKLSEKSENPRVIIKHLDSKRAFISFPNAFSRKQGNVRNKKGQSNKFRGHFLDLRTFTYALTNESHTLESACELFNTDVKKSIAEEHGKITPEYIDYNINDVNATYSLFCKTMEEFKKYNLSISPTKIYSPASLGKAYLKAMEIKSFQELNPDFPKEILGYVMGTYYGGRSEVRIRKTPVKICLIDFLSMYPTVCILQDLWKFVIAEKIKYVDDTEKVLEFVSQTTIDTCSNPETWKQLNAIVQILPNEDILPVRGKYGDKNTYNIGLNKLTRDTPIWYTLADVIASKLLTGISPKILKAFRFIPRGIQPLSSIQIIGDKMVNPTKEDFFKTLMEYRAETKCERKKYNKESLEYKQLDNKQKIIKIISNASSYGIFIQIDTIEQLDSKSEVYGIDEPFFHEGNTFEKEGVAFNPFISTLIASASRLILAISEVILKKHEQMYAFCDTDSLAIPPQYIEEIQTYFQKLTPYSFKDPLFKIEDQNYNEDTNQIEELWFYGISAKRYALYNMRNGKPYIRKYSLHGLGHILNPFNNKVKDWREKIWYDLLDEHYGFIKPEYLKLKYSGLYAVSEINITSPHILKRFKKMNEGKSISKQIKPFNFMLVGISNSTNLDTEEPIKPIVPYSKNPQSAVYGSFIDYNSGKTMEGQQYWKAMDEIFHNYKNHPESKFKGDIGILERRDLFAKSTVLTGKESNNLDESQVFGVQENDYTIYLDNKTKLLKRRELEELILHLSTKIVHNYRISDRTLRYWQQCIEDGTSYFISKKNLNKLFRIMRIEEKLIAEK